MKPFDLEKALAGEPVVTRDGRPVTQVTKFNIDSPFPVAGVIGGCIEYFTKNGTYRINGSYSCDLFMATKTVKKEGWVNLYKCSNGNLTAATSHAYKTEEEAKDNFIKRYYITTVKIQWEEEI